MGAAESTCEEWRKLPDRATMRKEVDKFCPSIKAVKHVRIMIHGPAGSGKSSFINSVNNVLQGRITFETLADATARESFTQTYKTHQFEKGENGKYYPFVMNDTMGLEKQKGIFKEDIILALKGHVKDGYKFNHRNPLSEGDSCYEKSPTLNDKVHILVSVIAADTISRMDEDVKDKIRDIRLTASNLGIPQIAILTKIDLACPLVGKDLNYVYKSNLLRQQMMDFSQKIGIPMNCIFPVKHFDVYFEDGTEQLILHALKQIIQFGNDFVKQQAAQ